MELTILVQAIIAMLMITAPPDPAKILLFNSIIEREGIARTAGALRVSVTVLVILLGSALVGRQLLGLLGINLDAFSIVGGLIIASMGFEMLYGGAPSRTQGGSVDEGEAADEGGLLIPLSTPLIAGPGAIVTTITIASLGEGLTPLIPAAAGALAVALVTFMALKWLGGWISGLSPTSTALLMRIGGMLLATIGAQMVLSGLRNYFGG